MRAEAEGERKTTWARDNASLLTAMRARIRAKIEADIAREEQAAEALRSDVRARIEDALHAFREQAGIGRIWLFGSFAWGRPGPRSDVDIFVEGGVDEDVLGARLAEACDREVHVVSARSAAPGLRERVEREGVLL